MPVNIFSVSSDHQDVESLLDNVAEAIHQWEEGGMPALDLSILLGEADKIAQQASRLKGQWNVDSSAVIQSTRPGLGPWIIRFQKTVRRYTWWYLEPIIHQIRVFQRNTALTADGLARNQETLLSRYENLVVEQAALRNRLEAIEDRLSRSDENTNADAAS
jgi:hypothetical protein